MRKYDINEYENYPTSSNKKAEDSAVATRYRTVQEKGSIAVLMAAATGLMVVDMSIHHLLMSATMFLTAIILAVPKEANKLLTNFEKLQRRLRINLYGILFGVLSIIFMLDFATAPANAQFFNSAQTWMTGAFEGIPQEGVTLFFNVLRALFLLYLGISLVRIVNAARNDDDWQNLARTPLIIVVTVVVGDIITGFIVGGGTGGTAP